MADGTVKFPKREHVHNVEQRPRTIPGRRIVITTKPTHVVDVVTTTDDPDTGEKMINRVYFLGDILKD